MKISAKAQASLSKVVERFQAGDLSPIVKIAKIKLDPNAPARGWTFSNRVMAFAQTGEADCRGYRQWQAAGRQVRKGERAAYILAPRVVTEENEDTGEKEREMRGFLTVAVFGYGQTDGDGSGFGYEPQELPPLAEVADRLGVEVDWSVMPAGLYGWCGRGKIGLGSYDPAVFFHELAHAAHRSYEAKTKAGQEERAETIAEFTACVLMELYGLGDRSGNAWEYISQYADDPLVAIRRALADVERVLGILLDETASQ